MKLKHDLLHTHSQILWLRCFLVSSVFLALLSITWLFSDKMKHQRSVMLIWKWYITIWYCGMMWLPTQIFVRKASSYIRLDLALKIRTKLRTHYLRLLLLLVPEDLCTLFSPDGPLLVNYPGWECCTEQKPL